MPRFARIGIAWVSLAATLLLATGYAFAQGLVGNRLFVEQFQQASSWSEWRSMTCLSMRSSRFSTANSHPCIREQSQPLPHPQQAMQASEERSGGHAHANCEGSRSSNSAGV